MVPQALSFDRPMWRTLPAFTSSASAESVSSISTSSSRGAGSLQIVGFEPKPDTFRSGQCTW